MKLTGIAMLSFHTPKRLFCGLYFCKILRYLGKTTSIYKTALQVQNSFHFTVVCGGSLDLCLAEECKLKLTTHLCLLQTLRMHGTVPYYSMCLHDMMQN